MKRRNRNSVVKMESEGRRESGRKGGMDKISHGQRCSCIGSSHTLGKGKLIVSALLIRFELVYVNQRTEAY